MSEQTALMPGIYYLSEATYHALGLQYASSHRLRTMATSGFEAVKHQAVNPMEPTPAMALGSAVHCLTLTPDKFKSQFAVAPKIDRRTKAGKEEWENFTLTAATKTVIKQDQYEQALDMTDSLRRHTSGLLNSVKAEDAEQTYISLWKDQPVKARIDLLKAGTLVDIKTTSSNLTIESLTRTVANYGYAEQMALYARSANACGKPVTNVVIAFVNTNAPYVVRCVEITPEWLEAAGQVVDARLTEWLAHMNEATNRDNFPSFPGIDDLDMPTWYGNMLG